LTFGHHPHPLGYLCAKFHFFSFAASIADLAHGEKSCTQSLTQLIWHCGNWNALKKTICSGLSQKTELKNYNKRLSLVFVQLQHESIIGQYTVWKNEAVIYRISLAYVQVYDIWQADSTDYVNNGYIKVIHHACISSTLPCKMYIFISETEKSHENSNNV